jgi:hypothetical protein
VRRQFWLQFWPAVLHHGLVCLSPVTSYQSLNIAIAAAVSNGCELTIKESRCSLQTRLTAYDGALCEGRAKVLVASDAMTRGMDVDNVQNIVNYDAPVYAKTYVHR